MPAEPVAVHILDREYRIACPPEQRRALMEAALHLDKQMRDVRDAGKLMSAEKIAVMCALNMADELLKLRQRELDRKQHVDSRVKELADKLDGTLDN